MSELDTLRRLGDQIVPPPFEALQRTARTRTRRTVTLVTTVAAVAAAAVVGGVLAATDHEPTPPAQDPEVNSSRPLTYAEGATVHYGEDTVTMPGPVAELDLTDDGVVARTEAGEILFTDGGDPEPLGDWGARDTVPDFGQVPESGVVYGDAAGYVVSPNTGSLVAWWEFRGEDDPVVVVYDTAARDQRLRQQVQRPAGSTVLLASVTERFVYWYVDPEDFDLGAPDARLDLATGEQSPVTPQQYAADRPPIGSAQTVLVSHVEGGGGPYTVSDGTAMQLDVDGGRVVPRGAMPLEVLDGATGARFTFDAPPGYPDTAPGWLTQWTDSDTVVIAYPLKRPTDLLECHVSSRACEVVATPPEAVLPEIG